MKLIKKIFFTCGILLFLTACGWEAESEYKKVLSETEGLQMEIDSALKENLILEEAKSEVLKEKEKLSADIKNMEKAIKKIKGEDESADNNPDTSTSGEYIVYTVKSGDYLSRVAQSYNVTLKDISSMNPGQSVEVLEVGQKIKIPKVVSNRLESGN